MVQTCVVRGCGSTWCPGSDIRFHAFPKNSAQRTLWLSIVPLKFKFYKSARICNLHFQESDYDLTTRRLKQTAVPTIISNQEAVSPCKMASSLNEESMVQIAALAIPSTSTGTYDSNFSLTETGAKRAGCNIEDQPREKQCRKILENISNLNQVPVCSEDQVPAKIDRGVQVNIKSTKEEILQKKSKILKQKVAQKTKKIQDMSSLMATVKKYTRQSEIENIIQGRFVDICKEFKKPPRNPHGVRYSEEVKAFALTLNFYSPKAYEFLRKYTTLPHVETIRRSLSLFNCNVGFLSEVLEYLKEQVKLPEKIYLKNVALIFGGMALKENLAYDQKLDKVVGYVDLGPISVSDPEKIASEALVFQIVSYGVVRFKCPIAYFFIANNLPGELISQLIKKYPNLVFLFFFVELLRPLFRLKALN